MSDIKSWAAAKRRAEAVMDATGWRSVYIGKDIKEVFYKDWEAFVFNEALNCYSQQ